MDILILDESYAPAILVSKARPLRLETGNWALHANHEEWDVDFSQMADKFMKTPFRLIATPICSRWLYMFLLYMVFFICMLCPNALYSNS